MCAPAKIQNAAVRRASAALALARPRTEVASRSLVGTVVRGYFGVSAALNKLNLARRANDKGEQFLTLTQSLERAQKSCIPT